MIPQTRHYVNRAVIFEHFGQYFPSWKNFLTFAPSSTRELYGAENFRSIVMVAGATHASSPYSMREAVGLCNFVLGRTRIHSTSSAVLYHECHKE